jgi:hypothetical protein
MPQIWPKTTPLQWDRWHIDEAHAQITLLISSTQAAPRCPVCDVSAWHVHSRDTRMLADLPWSGDQIMGRLRVRTLFCRNAVGGVISRWSSTPAARPGIRSRQ